MSRDYYERDTRPLSPREEYELRTGRYRDDPRDRYVDPREVSRSRYEEPPRRNDWDARREAFARDNSPVYREPERQYSRSNQSFESKLPVVDRPEDTYRRRESREVTDRPVEQKQVPQSIRVDNYEGIPVQLTKASRTWLMRQPYSYTFNADKEYNLLVKTNEGLLERIIRKKDVNVNYTDHEMDSNVKVKNLPIASSAKVLGSWVDFESVKSDDNVNTLINFTEIKTLKTTVSGPVSSFEEVRSSNIVELVKLGKTPYGHILLTEFNLTKKAFVQPSDISDVAIYLKGLYEYSSIEGMFKELVSLKNSLSDMMVFDLINTILTENINYIINTGFGIGWEIDNFYEGWGELKDAIISDIDKVSERELGFKETNIYDGINQGMYRDLIRSLTNHSLDDNGLLTLTSESVCGFIPIKAEDLCITVDEYGSLLRDENILLLAKGIIDKEKPSYISTVDNVIFRVTYGALNPEAVIIKKL